MPSDDRPGTLRNRNGRHRPAPSGLHGKAARSDALQAHQLAEASKRQGVPVVVGFMKRYSTSNRIASNILSSPSSANGPASSGST